MIEFSKEELQILHLELMIRIGADKNRGLMVPSHILSLEDKIYSMIENYNESKEWKEKMGMCDMNEPK